MGGGLLGLFALLVAGGVGFPVPEDLTLIGAGALVEQRMLPLAGVLVTGFLAIVTADWLLYLAGRRWGANLVGHPHLARVVGPERLGAAHTTIARNGSWAVFLARFVFGTRIVTFVGAGAFGVSPMRFGLAEAAGAAIFVGATTMLGHVFSNQAERALENVSHVEHWLGLLGAAALALYLLLRAWAPRRITPAAPRPGAAAPPSDPPRDPGPPT